MKPTSQLDNPLVPSNAASTAQDQRGAGTTNGNSYYDPSVAAPTAAYPSLGYAETGGAAGVQQNGNGNADSADGAHYLYATASAATAATASNATAAMEQAATQNPLIAFASQATQHVTGQAADNWPAQTQLMAHAASAPANPWHDWTNAMQDPQDRYSANALLTLNSARQGEVGAGGVVDHVSQGDAMGTTHAGQWPLLLFHDGPGGVSGA
jgi:hypothetical protein